MSIYAVNGKEPIAAWIPSRDDSGNGTTTLTDLVGSNNGTLTNMDAATDWVADTDAGGVRALDFDGVNDYVETPINRVSDLGTELTLSFWFWTRALSRQTIVGDWSSVGLHESARFEVSGFNVTTGHVGGNLLNNGALQGRVQSASAISTQTWISVVVVRTLTHVYLYVNGAMNDTIEAAQNSVSPGPGNRVTFGRAGAVNGLYFNGLLDDIRIWNVALDATDVAALYAGGFGRGITFGGVDKWALLRRGNRMGHIGIQSSPNQHIARGIRMAQMGITL